MAYAGIDVGTSGCKMVVYDEYGRILYLAKRTYQEEGTNGYRELDGALVWENVKDVIKEVAHNSPAPIEALAVASLGESILCLDKHDNILARSMLTGDKRGIAECAELEKNITKEEVMKITGLPLSEMYALPKFVWMNQNSDIFRRTNHIFFYEDFIGYKLTGQKMVSYSLASRSMAFDIINKTWSERLLRLAGLSSSLFSIPVPSGTRLGTILPTVCEETGLSPDTVVVAGGHDQGCAGLGSGMIFGSQGEDGQGTCEVMSFLMAEPIRTPYMIQKGIPCAPYVLPDAYLAQIELTNCGILMNWCRDTIFSGIRDRCAAQGVNFFSYMDSQVQNNAPSGLIILPSFGSSGNPDVSYDARGTIHGLTIHTSPAEIYQAVKEGMAYKIFMAFETLSPLGIRPETIRVTGGGALSDYTLQLRADIFNVTMERIESSESGTLGCAIIAALALHPELSPNEIAGQMTRVQKTFYPDVNRRKLYMEKYETYKKYYDLLTNFS